MGVTSYELWKFVAAGIRSRQLHVGLTDFATAQRLAQEDFEREMARE